MTKDEALDLALEALEQIASAMPFPVGRKAITAIKQARALDKKAENARELGLDYEPVLDVSLIDEGKTAAPVQEPVALRPEDVTVEVLMVQSGGGFAPLKTHGVKLTHKPTGIVVQCSSERSQHRNREQALRDLERYLHGARPQPTPPAQPAPVQEPIGYLFQHEETGLTTVVDVQQVEWGFEKNNPRHQKIGPVYTTPPAAQPASEADMQVYRSISDNYRKDLAAAHPAVPDAIHHTDLSEHPQYIEGWNDCRAEMLKGMKP
jgi:hypothetical protein